jgi:parallel beta-helix repeat protein
MRNCVVRDNQSNCGGGILSVRGVLAMSHCAVRDNIADGEGEPGFECGSGGAVKLEDQSEATLQGCTLTGNQAEGKGGGLHVSCTSAATLTNCTVSGNKAMGRGGGINAKGTLTLVHCTIQGNSAKGIVRGKRLGEQAGGGLSVGGRGILHVSNTLIANNPRDGDCALGENVTVSTNAYNLVEDGSCSPAFVGDPGLERLGDYGGDTPTHALLPGSPALDAIPAEACMVGVDQRGMPRPGNKGATDATCDVGAFELVAHSGGQP